MSDETADCAEPRPPGDELTTEVIEARVETRGAALSRDALAFASRDTPLGIAGGGASRVA